MHAAERVIDADERLAIKYTTLIFRVNHGNGFMALRATAAQRSEAFLLTLNLWDDSK